MHVARCGGGRVPFARAPGRYVVRFGMATPAAETHGPLPPLLSSSVKLNVSDFVAHRMTGEERRVMAARLPSQQRAFQVSRMLAHHLLDQMPSVSDTEGPTRYSVIVNGRLVRMQPSGVVDTAVVGRHVSLAHEEDAAAAVVWDDCTSGSARGTISGVRWGVDICDSRRIEDVVKRRPRFIARWVSSCKQIMIAPPPGWDHGLARVAACWTVREAVVKVIGDNKAVDAGAFRFPSRPDSGPCKPPSSDSGVIESCSFNQILLGQQDERRLVAALGEATTSQPTVQYALAFQGPYLCCFVVASR